MDSDDGLSFYELDAKRDARLAGMQPGEEREFKPPPERAPEPFESRFLELNVATGRMRNPKWVNRPKDWGRWGSGKGYPEFKESPLFTYPVKRALVPLSDVWHLYGNYLMSEAMISVIERYDPDGIQHHAVTFRFADGLEPDCPCRLVDFVRVYDGVDHARSVIRYKRWEKEIEEMSFARDRIGKRNYTFHRPFTLMPAISPDIHVFRPRGTDDERGHPPLFSRELIKALAACNFCCLKFSDPAIGPYQHHGTLIDLGEASDWDFNMETWDAYYH